MPSILSRGKSMAQITRDTIVFSAIRTMALHPGAHLYDSTLALRAMSEAVLFVVVFPLGFTLYFHPELVWTNGLYLVLGYNDVCFAFDSAPANIVAGPLFVFVAYLGMLHAHTRIVRLQERDDVGGTKRVLIQATYVLFAFASASFPVTLISPPELSIYWHSYPYLFFRAMHFLALVASVAEHTEDEPIPAGTTTFLVIAGIAAFVFTPLVLFIYSEFESVCGFSPTYAAARACPEWPAARTVSPWISGIADYLFFAVLPLAPIFLPASAHPIPSLQKMTSVKGDAMRLV